MNLLCSVNRPDQEVIEEFDSFYQALLVPLCMWPIILMWRFPKLDSC